MSAEEDIGRKKEEVYTLEEVARHKKAKDCWSERREWAFLFGLKKRIFVFVGLFFKVKSLTSRLGFQTILEDLLC